MPLNGIGKSEINGLAELSQIESIQKGCARCFDLTDQGRLLELGGVDLLGPGAADDVGDSVELGLIHKEARIDLTGVGNHAKAQAGGSASVRHRLANVDDFDPA